MNIIISDSFIKNPYSNFYLVMLYKLLKLTDVIWKSSFILFLFFLLIGNQKFGALQIKKTKYQKFDCKIGNLHLSV